ncbi:hypothetical protein BDV95DRAFT_69318 [Massariosphaeria phaeospora]|uniref:Uncharacterized protein n=1 Tax=Massariosphaeria phaeospora TaxID=100035 RepID=A0A7C8I6X3_9PLEO|nr:hypothetical protein BDV95DRAFT_69318 [Massariosphaeria phaeospora]
MPLASWLQVSGKGSGSSSPASRRVLGQAAFFPCPCSCRLSLASTRARNRPAAHLLAMSPLTQPATSSQQLYGVVRSPPTQGPRVVAARGHLRQRHQSLVAVSTGPAAAGDQTGAEAGAWAEPRY